jgi:hypothetical protein
MSQEKPKNPNDIRDYWNRLLDERVRTYIVIAIAALMVVFLAQIMGGSLIAGGVPFLLGLLAMGLGWSALPVVVVVAVAWFQALPFGLPTGPQFSIPTSRTYFRITDIMLAGSVLVYLAAQYRVYSLAKRALADERPVNLVPITEVIDKRSPDLIDDSEIPRSFMAIAGIVLLAQFAWLILNSVSLDFSQFPPIRPGVTDEERRMLPEGRTIYARVASRWVLFVLVSGVTVFLVRLGLWYWRLLTLTRDEARLIVTDTSWYEMRREAARQETWRISGIRKATAPVAIPKRVPRNQPPKPSRFFPLLVRGCFLVLIAMVVAVTLVCLGAGIMSSRGW